MFDKLKSLIKSKSFTTLIGFGDFNHSYLWTRNNSLSLYEKSLYVNKAISKRAEKVGEIEFRLLDRKGNQVENEWLDLLNKPNPYQTGDQFWRLAQKYYDIVGAVFILKESTGTLLKKVDSLKLLRSDLVEVILNQSLDEIVRFDYHNQGVVSQYQPDEVIYIYNPSPRNPLLGESLIASAIRSIETEVEISSYHSNVLKNGGKLESIFKVKNSLNRQQLQELEAQYQEKYAGAAKAGRPLFMGGDIEKITTGLSPHELAYLDTKLVSLKDICIATGVPMPILGITAGETYSNSEMAVRIFLRETIKPLLSNITDILDWRLIPEQFELTFVDPTPEDKDDKRKDIETADRIHSLSTNEKRDLLGLDPVKEGDKILVPFNLAPLTNEKPQEKPQEKPEEKIVRKAHPLRNESFRRMYGKAFVAKRQQNEARALVVIREYLKDQKDRVVGSMKGKRKISIDEFLNRGLEISLAEKALLPIIRQIFIETGQDTAEIFNLTKFQYDRVMEDSITRRINEVSGSIINTQSDKLVRLFKESAENEETRQDLIKRIGDLYTDVSEKWAGVIARTEVHVAMQEATLATYKQAGLEIKIWVWSGNTTNLRDSHLAMDGQEVGIDQPFITGNGNKVMYPGDGPAEEAVNCACTI